jgi:hypothetical protein
MKIKITGKDKGDLLPLSTDLQFSPVLTCTQESLAERNLLEAYREVRAGIRELVTNPPQLRAVLQKENINLSFFSATYDFLKTYNMELVSSLFSSTSLISLNFFGTQLGELGSRELANVLKTTNSLSYLKVSYNDMGYYGQLELSHGLTKNKSLTALDLSNNSNVNYPSYFFNLCLPEINPAEKIVNNYPQPPHTYSQYDSTSPLELFHAIGQHPAIRYFSFGTVTNTDFLTLMHNKMLGAKGLVFPNIIIGDGVVIEGFNQLSYLANFKDNVEQINKLMIINFMTTMQEVAEYMGEERSIKFSPTMIAQCLKFTNLLAGASEKTIDLPIEIREFIGDNYLLFLLAVLRKETADSLLEKLPLDIYKNISSYLFNLNLGKWPTTSAIDYSVPEEDEMSIVGAVEEYNIEDII